MVNQSSEARCLRHLYQTTVSRKAKALSFGKTIISNEARGQRGLDQPAASSEARG